MKYTENYRKKRLGAGFYVAIALCLLIIGGASWFALAPLSEKDTESEMNNSSRQEEYTDPTEPYTESTPQITPELTPNSEIMQSTENNTESTAETTTSESEAVTTKEEKVLSFTMPVQGEIIKNHSSTELQYSKTFGDMRLHTGFDIACKEGTSVSACATGTVTEITNDANLGNCVVIDHGDKITVRYCSIENLKVEKGSRVNTGDVIGTVGTVPSECNDETHIHIEVTKDGKAADPLKTFGLE